MFDFRNKKIYLIGIKGVGLTMLAQFLARTGNEVSGSDTAEVFLTDQVLRREKIEVKAPFAAANIPQSPDVIIYSSAYEDSDNPEMNYWRANPEKFKSTLVLSYAAALGAIFNRYKGIAVCGSHGKTTTSAWLGYVLQRAGRSPNVLVGSRVPQFKGSSLVGRSPYFIAEVDEYQNKLRYFQPQGVVLNNIDYDHPDFFKSPSAYFRVFREFIKKVPRAGFLIINQADAEIRRISRFCPGKIISYSTVPQMRADYQATDFRQEAGSQFFKVAFSRRSLGEFRIRLAGKHNITNALAVIAAARRLGLPLAAIKKGLASFRGTDRRAQVLGHYRGALIIDDYAHHPTEIQATLAGFKERYPRRRLIVVFHPHTFTRTQKLFKDFIKSFALADEVIVLDIYGSAREKQGGVSSRELAEGIKRFNQRRAIPQGVRYLPLARQATAYLKKSLAPNDLVVLMGAGDVFRIGQDLLP